MPSYLDAAGLTFLWSKISMEDYPNNETLIAILNAIDETKADKDKVPSINETLLTTPQTLTEEQKFQVKKNLGLISDDEYITVEHTYFYDGDRASENHTWVVNNSGDNVFVKMGEIPEGKINLLGATLLRRNPKNQWLNRTITITEEDLTKTQIYGTNNPVIIPAIQNGMTQIFHMMESDSKTEFSILCICTKPGFYYISFDGWYEYMEFKETGIFGYEKRNYSGNDYLESFTFTTTIGSENEGEEGEEEGGENSSNTSTPINYKGNEIQVFSRGICIGDSVTEGTFDDDANGFIVKHFSYPAILKRLTNIDIINAGIAGATSAGWYEASLNSDTIYGKWVNDEWVWHINPPVGATDIVSSELNYSNFDFAIIHLGINDLGFNPDSPIEELVNNFNTNINTIITKLKTDSPGIKIFLATIIPTYATPDNFNYRLLNRKIIEIANSIEDVFLIDLNQYSELATQKEYSRNHPTALGYHKLANEIKSYISYIIKNNLSEFVNIQSINKE